MTDRLSRKTKLQPYHYSLCGAFSGVVTRAIAQPLDVLKIRFQLQTEPIRRRVVNGKTFSSKYSGIIQAANLIVKEEGITALWKGHVPAQGLSVIYGSSLFLTFELLKVLNQANNKHSSFSKRNFLYGGVAGIVATMCCHPLDVIRTRFVSQDLHQFFTRHKINGTGRWNLDILQRPLSNLACNFPKLIITVWFLLYAQRCLESFLSCCWH